MYIARIPKHVPKAMLPGLKMGALVRTLHADYSQGKNSFETKPIPAGTVGRVKVIWDFGPRIRNYGHRFYCDIKFEGHPVTGFYAEELAKVRV